MLIKFQSFIIMKLIIYDPFLCFLFSTVVLSPGTDGRDYKKPPYFAALFSPLFSLIFVPLSFFNKFTPPFIYHPSAFHFITRPSVFLRFIIVYYIFHLLSLLTNCYLTFITYLVFPSFLCIVLRSFILHLVIYFNSAIRLFFSPFS